MLTPYNLIAVSVIAVQLYVVNIIPLSKLLKTPLVYIFRGLFESNSRLVWFYFCYYCIYFSPEDLGVSSSFNT